ncbi:protein kinase domain-containing protein [Streptomyces sp. 372A]
MASDGPRVLDFGIARALESTRLTATGVAFGTPGFLAPEQAQGLEVGGAADVFALGAVLVAAAGGSAFGAGTPMGLMYRSVHEAPDLGAVPAGVRDIVAACLEKEPAQRPTPDDLLDRFVPGAQPYVPPPAHAPTVAVPPQPPHPPADATPPSARPAHPPAQAGPAPYGHPPAQAGQTPAQAGQISAQAVPWYQAPTVAAGADPGVFPADRVPYGAGTAPATPAAPSGWWRWERTAPW